MQKQRRKAERSCIACRGKGDQKQFLRYVVSPEQKVVVDYRHRLPGRGAYTCLSRSCIEAAVERNSFDRALRRELDGVKLEEIIQDATFSIEQRIDGLIGIARKAGSVVTGTSQLQSAFNRQEIRYLVVARDASEGSAERMIRMAEQEGSGWSRYSSQKILGQLAGRDNRNCIGIKDKQFAELLALEIENLQQIAGEN